MLEEKETTTVQNKMQLSVIYCEINEQGHI